MNRLMNIQALSRITIITGGDGSASDGRNIFMGLAVFFVNSILNYCELVKYNNGVVDTIFMIAGDSYLDEVFFEDFNVNTIDPKE